MLRVILFLAFSLNAHGQVSLTCQNGNCSSSNASIAVSNLEHISVVPNLLLDDSLIVNNEADNTPWDLKLFLSTRTLQGQNVSIDLSSKIKSEPSANSVIIADSIRNLNVNVDGYSGVVGDNSSVICAKNIMDGNYGSQIRNAFLARRGANPTLSGTHCDSIDLNSIQNLGLFSCQPQQVELPTQQVTGTRWEVKRQCNTMAGRELCVAKRVSLKCEIFADRPTGSTQCCDSISPPTASSNWKCNINRCNGQDSGWHMSFQFRLWEEEYSNQVKSGYSNETICNKLTGVSEELEDVIEVKNKTYVATAEFFNNSDDFNIYPPVGENVISTKFSAGVCGSATYDTSETFTDFSSWFNSGVGYIRMKGEGRAVDCVGVANDYPENHFCRNAINATSNPSLCYGKFDEYPMGGQCWEELLPVCSSPNYEDYELGSYCYRKKINECAERPFSSFPEGSFCRKILKERQCGGSYTEYPEGSRCWVNLLNSQTCSLEYHEYSTGSFCYNQKAPDCSSFEGLNPEDNPEITTMPHYNFCVAYANGINMELYPGSGNCNPLKNFNEYPIGSSCWSELQPNCVGVYTDYPVGSYCREKLTPTCNGSYTDYPEGSHCHQYLKPDECVESFASYPAGSFCHEKLIPLCSGTHTDYLEGSYCYEKLKTNCPGVHTDYTPGSYCFMKLDNSCSLNWNQYPAGSFCWKNKLPVCSGVHTDYPADSFCYNELFPGQNSTLSISELCAIKSGEGSMCWRESFPDCSSETNPTYGSYCWYKNKETNFCSGVYSDYPRNSYCWGQLREAPQLFYRNPDNCSISCSWSGTYASCELGNPANSAYFENTSATYIGQRTSKDSQVSFKVRFTVLTSFGMERNFDTQVNIKVSKGE